MIITFKGEAFYQTPDAAKALGRSIYTIQKWCRQGRLEAVKKYGRDFAIPERSVQKMQNSISLRKGMEVS